MTGCAESILKLKGEIETMERPYTVCHMMMSVDGRIDCAMTEQLSGVEDYYSSLDALELPTTVSGRVTAERELALPGAFQAGKGEAFGKEGFSKKVDAKGYEVIVDTKGTLLWPDASDMEKPYLIVTSGQVKKEYLDYLDTKAISWIVNGEDKINLAKAAEVLREEFGVDRMGIVGGAAINTSFLDAGLLDEISLLIGAGIDGRAGMPSVFDGLPLSHPLIHLELAHVQKLDSGAVWLRYRFRGGV